MSRCGLPRGMARSSIGTSLNLPILLAGILLALALACRVDDGGKLRLQLVKAGGETAALLVEVADTPEKRERGLTGRESLARDEGMLFAVQTRGRGFWMKDTSIPLSVAFIDRCGMIVATADMEPYSLEIHQTPFDYGFGLEVNRGWFVTHGIGAGDRVELPPYLSSSNCRHRGGVRTKIDAGVGQLTTGEKTH